MNGSNDGPSIFDSIFGKGKPIKWYHYLIHLGYYIPYWIKFFFSEPFKEKKKDLNILDTVKSLLESETTDGNIKKSKELIHLHRIVENTKARRRLEKWSLRVIALYLFIVLCILFFSGSILLHVIRFNSTPKRSLSNLSCWLFILMAMSSNLCIISLFISKVFNLLKKHDKMFICLAYIWFF